MSIGERRGPIRTGDQPVIDSSSSVPKRCAMQPITTSRASSALASSRSRMVSTDSALAASMKAQVLTITTSASSGDPAER